MTSEVSLLFMDLLKNFFWEIEISSIEFFAALLCMLHILANENVCRMLKIDLNSERGGGEIGKYIIGDDNKWNCLKVE